MTVTEPVRYATGSHSSGVSARAGLFVGSLWVDAVSVQEALDRIAELVDKAKKDLDAFALANDARMYKLFKACVDPQSDLRTIVKSRVGPRSGTV